MTLACSSPMRMSISLKMSSRVLSLAPAIVPGGGRLITCAAAAGAGRGGCSRLLSKTCNYPLSSMSACPACRLGAWLALPPMRCWLAKRCSCGLLRAKSSKGQC